MAIKDFIVASGKYGAYSHYQLRLKKRIVQKTPNLIYQDGGSVRQAMPSFKAGNFGLKYRLHADDGSAQIMKNKTFRLHRQDGSVLQGATDEKGESSLLNMHKRENAALELIKGVKI